MISSVILKNKLCGILSRQPFVRLPLKIFHKLSYFLQNLKRIDYNQPRNKLSMNRIQKMKKRRNNKRQNWNLKKYWTLRGIGLKLDIIKEEGDKEYLAEIENEDDSLDYNEFGEPNNVLIHKNSGTYFGLVKFPANFSPSELALQHLCHGRTLHQAFPNQTKSLPSTKLSRLSCFSTMTEPTSFKDSEVSKRNLFHIKKDPSSNYQYSQDYKSLDDKLGNFIPSQINIPSFQNDCTEQVDDKYVQKKFRKVFRNKKGPRYPRRYSTLNNSKFYNVQEPAVEKLTNNTKALSKTIVVPRISGIKRNISKISCKSDFINNSRKNKIRRTYASSEPGQQRNALLKTEKNPRLVASLERNSDLNMAASKPDLSMADLNILTIENEENTTCKSDQSNLLPVTSFENLVNKKELDLIESSFNVIGKSLENILGATDLNQREQYNNPLSVGCDFVDLEAKVSEDLTKIFDGCKLSLNSIETDFNLEDLMDLKMEECAGDNTTKMDEDFPIVNNDSNNRFNYCGEGIDKDLIVNDQNEQILGDENSEKVNLPNFEQSPTRAKSLYTNTSRKSSSSTNILPNYSVNMSGIVRRIFGIDCPISNISNNNDNFNTTTEQIEKSVICTKLNMETKTKSPGSSITKRNGHRRNSDLYVSCGFTERRVARRNMVQLDHQSLWTEFVSDMIVNNRVRKVQIKGA